jgi:hypothetical protein
MKRDTNDMRIKVLESNRKFKKINNRIELIEEGIEMPELDDLLVEGKEVDTKVLLGLMKTMQRDIMAKCVPDTKLQPISMALVDLEAKLDDIVNEKIDLTNNDDFMELQATMAAFPMKITAIQSSSMRSENGIFEIDLEIKNLMMKITDMEKAREGTKGLRDLLLKGDE